MQNTQELNTLHRMPFRKLFTRQDWMTIYTRLVSFTGLAILVYAIGNFPRDLHGLWWFILLGVITELTSIQLFTSSRSTVSISSIIAIASIAAFGPLAGIFAYVASGLTTGITSTIQDRKSTAAKASIWKRTSFNVGMWVIAGFIAGQVFALLGGVPGNNGHLTNIAALAAATVVEWLANAAILIGVISMQTRRAPTDIWRRDLSWQAPVSIIGGVLGGGILALAYEKLNVFGILIVLLPILATGYAFRLYKNNMQEYVDGLESVNRELKEAMTALETANIDLITANSSIRRLNAELFHSLAKVFDMRDPYVGGHAAQVAVYAVAIATEMGLHPEQVERVRQSAFLHDIGKLAIPEAILHKTGKLTALEYEFIKTHTDIGADLLDSTEGLKHLAPFVRYHHERWDGEGYPRGLAGDEIPLESRILSVCDAVESMASDRPYHRAMSVDAIITEVERCAGSQFDPAIAEVFIQLMLAKPGDAFVVNSARSVTQQYASSILANESIAPSTFAWVLEDHTEQKYVGADSTSVDTVHVEMNSRRSKGHWPI